MTTPTARERAERIKCALDTIAEQQIRAGRMTVLPWIEVITPEIEAAEAGVRQELHQYLLGQHMWVGPNAMAGATHCAVCAIERGHG